MTERTAPPGLADQISQLKRRVDALERQLRPAQELFKPEIVFSHSGPVTVSLSCPWLRRFAGRLMAVPVLLRVPGSTPTTVTLYMNGVGVLDVTVPADQHMVIQPTSIGFAPAQDILWVGISEAGTGAEDITVLGWFRG